MPVRLDQWRASLSAHPTFLPLPGLTRIKRRARPFAPTAIPPTNIAHVLAGKRTPKGHAPARPIEFVRDLGITQIGGEFVNPRNGLRGGFPGPFSPLDALHV